MSLYKAPIFLMLLLVSSSLIHLSDVFTFVPEMSTSFGLDSITTIYWPASFDLKKPKHFSSNHCFCCFSPFRPRLSLAEVLIFS